MYYEYLINDVDAMFGTPFHSNPTIIGKLEFYDDIEPGGGCKDYVARPSVTRDDEFMGPRVFVLIRGGCTFTHKIRTAQQKGAGAVIIVDNKCFTKEVEKYPEWSKVHCSGSEDRIPYMQDDRTDGSITIPGLHITKYAGLQLIDCLRMSESGFEPLILSKSEFASTCDVNARIIVRIELDIPNPDNNVEWELWYSADNIPDDIYGVGAISESLIMNSDFTPRHIFRKKSEFGFGDEAKDYCVGDFCIIPANQNMKGVDIIYEQIRQFCLWEEVKGQEDAKKKGEQHLWWDYMQVYQQKVMASKSCNLECSDSLLPSKFKSATLACEAKEKNAQTHASNMFALQKERGIFTNSLVVNTVRQDFSLKPSFVAHVVCMGFAKAGTPPVCQCVNSLTDDKTLSSCINAKCFDEPKKSFYCQSLDVCVVNEAACHTSDATSFGGMFFMVLFVACLVGGVAYVYHTRSRRRMQEEVRDILSEYMPLEELSSFNPNSSGGFTRAGSGEDNVGVI